LTDFQDKNYDWLIERFLKENADAWDTFLIKEFDKAQAQEPEYNPEDDLEFEEKTPATVDEMNFYSVRGDKNPFHREG